MSVSLASSRRAGKKSPQLAVQDLPITAAESESNREYLLKFNAFNRCSDVFAIAVACAVNEVILPQSRATKFRAVVGKTMEMGETELNESFRKIDLNALGYTSRIPLPLTVTSCAPVKTHMGSFFSMNSEFARLIEASIIKLLDIIKKGGDKPAKAGTDDAFTAKEIGLAALNAILEYFTDNQLKVLNAMAESGNIPDIWEVGKTGDLIAKLHEEMGERSLFDHAFGGDNYLVPIYTLIRRLKIAVGKDITKELFHASDRNLQVKLGPLLAKLSKPALEPIAEESRDEVPTGDDSHQDIETVLRKVKDLNKCSKKFSELISVAASKFAAKENEQSFSTLLKNWMNESDNTSVCLPMFEHVGDFVAISQKTATEIGKSIVEAAQGDEKYPYAARLSEVAKAIWNFMEPGQLMLGEVMSRLASSDDRRGICSPTASADMTQNFEGNYFLSLYQFLKNARSCIATPIGAMTEPKTGFDERCSKLAGMRSISVNDLYTCLSGAPYKRHKLGSTVHDETTESVIAGESDSKVEAAVKPTPDSKPSESSKSASNKLESQTTILSSIATQEKLFFTNFHNAAQQLSILGIKAVGLATQIQAIRGHMMMLQLIDEHIDQLDGDHRKYTGLLDEALKQLESVTESPKT